MRTHLHRITSFAVTFVAAAAPALAQEGGHAPEGPVNLLAPEAGLMFWTLIIFGSLFLLLRRFAWPTLLAMVEKREMALRDALAAANRDRDEAARILADHTAKLEAARGEAQKLIADGRAAAEKMKAQAVGETKKQQDELLARAKRDIETEKARAIADLRAEAVDLALRGASKVLERNLDDATNRKLVEDFLASVGKR